MRRLPLVRGRSMQTPRSNPLAASILFSQGRIKLRGSRHAKVPAEAAADTVATTVAEAHRAADQVRARKPDPRWEEVRLAMALNGGVSLAVWMGGVAVELDC